MHAPYPVSQFSSFGILSTAPPVADRLEVSGWVISPEAVAIDGMHVFVGDEEVQARVVTRLLSDDVQKVYPSLEGATNARFRATVTGPSTAFPVVDRLVAAVPTSNGRTGTPLFTLVAPQISLPSEEVLKVTGGSFKAAYEFLGYFLDYCALRTDQAVLDVGCGCGRMAYPLAYYLKPPGRYEGFDIVSSLIASASAGLTPTFPHMRFRTVDVFNSMYNPRGTVKSSELVFPYQDQSFDLVFLTSVFTHMFPEDVRRYLSEIHRVLRPGGKVLMTCFLLTPDAEELITAGRSSQALKHVRGECKIAKRLSPEAAVGFAPERFRAWSEAAGFKIDHVALGSWCGRPRTVSYQDIVVATKARS